MNRDQLGILLSSSCMVHCLLLPAAALFMPALVPFAENEAVHLTLFFLIAMTTGLVFFRGSRPKAVMYCGIAGLSLLGGALAFEGQPIEKYVTTAGSIFLILGHVINARSRRVPHPNFHQNVAAQR